ncbi:MAG: hypothetical protein K0M70_15170 [Arenimonas sp.]|uniref:hypothetical protein n=1 Tax=Arenimonas sp. TaxID=1872635 RepID=UPI0025C5A949|nr:hypothetical protein [Arenimonas sp.]MBW8369184.1 hypothetical protein [Arenimonas sp.]
MEQLAAFGGMILVVLAVMVVLGLLLGGLVLKVTVRLLQGFSPSFGKSVLVVFLAGVAGFVVNIVLSMVMGVGSNMAMAGADEAAMAGAMMASLGAMAISLLASLFITALFVNLMIQQPTGQPIGYGRSCLISLLYLVVMVVIGIVASIVLALVVGIGAAGLASVAG